MYTVIFIAIVTYLLYRWVKATLTYWKDRGVNGPTPLPFVGNYGNILIQKSSLNEFMSSTYKKYTTEKVVGIYQGFKPMLLIRDPEIIKHVLIKDFSIFQDRGVKTHDDDKFNDRILTSEGETWRILRHKLTPIFTSNKLKNMVPLIDNSIDHFMRYVDTLVDQGKNHEIKLLASKYTLEVVGSCVFGVEMKTFTEEQNPFYLAVEKIFVPSGPRKLLQAADFFIPKFSKYIYKLAKISFIDQKVKDTFISLVNLVVTQREGKKKLRNDFMDLMIELKEQKIIEKKETDKTISLEFDTELLAAQAIIFFAAGFETSSSTMSFMMYELARHPDIQQRVYENVIAVMEKNGGKITYDSISEMTYLEMCFDETLRLYPVVASLLRKCTENYRVPGTNITIENGTGVYVSVLGLGRDPQFFKDPEVFDPERFSPENKQNINKYTYLPFGEGPRNCIGMRFAKEQSMMGMAAFISKFKLEQSERTPNQIEFNPMSGTLASIDGIWLKITRR